MRGCQNLHSLSVILRTRAFLYLASLIIGLNSKSSGGALGPRGPDHHFSFFFFAFPGGRGVDPPSPGEGLLFSVLLTLFVYKL